MHSQNEGQLTHLSAILSYSVHAELCSWRSESLWFSCLKKHTLYRDSLIASETLIVSQTSHCHSLRDPSSYSINSKSSIKTTEYSHNPLATANSAETTFPKILLLPFAHLLLLWKMWVISNSGYLGSSNLSWSDVANPCGLAPKYLYNGSLVIRYI